VLKNGLGAARADFFTHKYRYIGINKPMDTKNPPANKGGKTMEFLILLGVVVGWIILQAWILPRFGVKT
jgi:hypothetical protein